MYPKPYSIYVRGTLRRLRGVMFGGRGFSGGRGLEVIGFKVSGSGFRA